MVARGLKETCWLFCHFYRFVFSFFPALPLNIGVCVFPGHSNTACRWGVGREHCVLRFEGSDWLETRISALLLVKGTWTNTTI